MALVGRLRGDVHGGLTRIADGELFLAGGNGDARFRLHSHLVYSGRSLFSVCVDHFLCVHQAVDGVGGIGSKPSVE